MNVWVLSFLELPDDAGVIGVFSDLGPARLEIRLSAGQEPERIASISRDGATVSETWQTGETTWRIALVQVQ